MAKKTLEKLTNVGSGIYCVGVCQVGGIDKRDAIELIRRGGGLDEAAEQIILRDDFVISLEPRPLAVVAVTAGRLCNERHQSGRFLEDENFLRAWSGRVLHSEFECLLLPDEGLPSVAMGDIEVNSTHVWCGMKPKPGALLGLPNSHGLMFKLAGYVSGRPRRLEAHLRKDYPAPHEYVLLEVRLKQ